MRNLWRAFVLLSLAMVLGTASGCGSGGSAPGTGSSGVTAGEPTFTNPLRVGPFHLPKITNNAGSADPPYNPTQIRNAYGVTGLTLQGGSPNFGTGQVIAIIDAAGSESASSLQTDLATFHSTFFPAPTVVPTPNMIIHQMFPNVTGAGSNDLETALDIEWAHAMAPGAEILLVQARALNLADLLSAIDFACAFTDPTTGAPVTIVSMSFGGGEFSNQRFYDTHFRRNGITFLASSGDSGDTTKPPSTQWPAACPLVVGVGGTTLQADSNGAVISETAWNDSGGGPSDVEPRPSYQSPFVSGSFRTVPDVAFVGNPATGVEVFLHHGTTEEAVGGTSVGAPSWAGLVALANAQRVAGGLPVLNSLAADLYTLGASQYLNASTHFFTDIISGNNTDELAGTGYDEVTGLGTPLAQALMGVPGQGLAASSSQ